MNTSDLTPQAATPASPRSTQQATLQALEAKIDQLLEYQKSAHRWAIVKGVFNFTLFFVLVILPIVWFYTFMKSIVGEVDFSKLADQYKKATELMNQVDQMEGQIKDVNIQELIQKALTK